MPDDDPKYKLADVDAVINYAFVPATVPAIPAITGPGAALDLSHIRPIAGGINAELKIRWVATSPILCGNEGGTIDYGESKTKLTSPLKTGNYGNYCLSGSALAGMIRNVLKVSTGSYYGPINRAYINGQIKKNSLKRGEYPITSADINLVAKSRSTNDRVDALDKMKKDTSKWQTIAAVADRSYIGSHPPVLDWANAMMGFVLGDDTNSQNHKDQQWRPEWPENVEDTLPQGLQSRVGFSFAKCVQVNPKHWPVGLTSALKIPGAGPKVTYDRSYLKTGKWNTPDAELAGLKVYPVHNPDLVTLKEQTQFDNFRERNRTDGKAFPQSSDTLLQFLCADKDNPVEFEGIISCHNLAPLEFGALIWSLFLGETVEIEKISRDLRHNLGHLRAYGMGQLAPKLLNASLSVNPTEDQARQELEGDVAVERLNAEMMAFQKCEEVKTAEPARNRLLLFKSLTYGEKMQKAKRIKPYNSKNQAPFFDKLSNDYKLMDEDNDLAKNP